MDHKLLDRFFKGECSSEENRKVLNWYFSGEADEELSEKIAAYWRSERIVKSGDWGREDVFQQVANRIEQISSKEKPVIPIYDYRSNQNKWVPWRYAAAVLLLITFGSCWFFFVSQNRTSQPEEVSYISKQTGSGEKRTVTLIDGTLVKLNAESSIRYRAKFNQDSIREVFLEGEAFFDVAEDASHPFIIHTGCITTTVLGTSFNINAYEPEKVEVSVVSGNVKVQQQDGLHEQTVYLLPQEQAICSNSNTVIIKREFDLKHVLSWKGGTLYFQDAGFPEIVKTLERWYGVEMVVQKNGIKDGFSGSYTDKSLEYVLNGMSFVLKFEYEIKGETVVIK